MKKITGVMIYYHEICDKRLWYFSKGLNMESSSELVSIGKIIDENSYSKERKQILIDDKINVDFLDDWRIIHEVKKSDKLEYASIWQVKYYIYILRNKDVNIEKGILDYPKLRKRTTVYLNEEDVVAIENKIKEIKKIISNKYPLEVSKKTYCKKCSYHDFCYL